MVLCWDGRYCHCLRTSLKPTQLPLSYQSPERPQIVELVRLPIKVQIRAGPSEPLLEAIEQHRRAPVYNHLHDVSTRQGLQELETEVPRTFY